MFRPPLFGLHSLSLRRESGHLTGTLSLQRQLKCMFHGGSFQSRGILNKNAEREFAADAALTCKIRCGESRRRGQMTARACGVGLITAPGSDQSLPETRFTFLAPQQRMTSSHQRKTPAWRRLWETETHQRSSMLPLRIHLYGFPSNTASPNLSASATGEGSMRSQDQHAGGGDFQNKRVKGGRTWKHHV